MRPIEHVIIIVRENRTVDNYFGTFPGAVGVTLPEAPDPQESDPLHDHAAWLAAQASGGGLRLQYSKADIAAYWAYAQQYSLCDNYFADVTSQSAPNHLHLIAASSPIIDNATKARRYQPEPPFHMNNFPATLEVGGHTWRNYADARSSYFDHIVGRVNHPWNVASSEFDTDAGAGKLPLPGCSHRMDSASTHATSTTPETRSWARACNGQSIGFMPPRLAHCGPRSRSSLRGTTGEAGTTT